MAYTDFDVKSMLWLEGKSDLSELLSYIAKEHNDFAKQKLFISYAWDTEELQTLLKELKKILIIAGIPSNNVFLDITGQMHGNLVETMQSSLASAHRVLLISTKQYRTRMQVEGSGVHVEYSHVSKLIEEEKKPSSFIVPLNFDGFEFVPKECRANLAYNCKTTRDFLMQIIPILKELHPALRDDKTFEAMAMVFDMKMKMSLSSAPAKMEKNTHALDGKTMVMVNAWSGENMFVSFKSNTKEMRAIYTERKDAMPLKFHAAEQADTYFLLNVYSGENQWVSFTNKGKWLKAAYTQKDAMPIKFVPVEGVKDQYTMQNMWSGEGGWISFKTDGKWLRAIYEVKDAMPVKLIA